MSWQVMHLFEIGDAFHDAFGNYVWVKHTRDYHCWTIWKFCRSCCIIFSLLPAIAPCLNCSVGEIQDLLSTRYYDILEYVWKLKTGCNEYCNWLACPNWSPSCFSTPDLLDIIMVTHTSVVGHDTHLDWTKGASTGSPYLHRLKHGEQCSQTCWREINHLVTPPGRKVTHREPLLLLLVGSTFRKV